MTPTTVSAEPQDSVVYCISTKWRLIFALPFSPGLLWPALITFNFHSFTSRGALLANLVVSLFLVDLCAILYWWAAFYPRLVVSSAGIEFRGTGAYIRTSWDNVIGTKTVTAGWREIAGLRLLRPRLRGNGPLRVLYAAMPVVRVMEDADEPFSSATFAATTAAIDYRTPADGSPQGGVVATGAWESDHSMAGQPNDFIPRSRNCPAE